MTGSDGETRMFAPPVAKPKAVPSGRGRADAEPASRPQRGVAAGARAGHPVPAVPRIPIRAKLTLGAPDDPLEHEADRVADQVMRMTAPAIGSAAARPQVSRKCAACADEEERLQAKTTGGHLAAGEVPATVHEVLRSHGQPLDAAARDLFEPRFGHDFARVRIHAGPRAAQSADDVRAEAYTVGQDIVFNTGRYRPQTPEGQRLLAHELTHVIQQSAAPAGAGRRLSRKPLGDASAPAPTVAQMDANEAVAVIKRFLPGAAGESEAALNAIADTLRMPFTMANAAYRLRMLTAAFSLLDAQDAAMLHAALTKPANPQQQRVQAQFSRLDHRFRTPLLHILDARAGGGSAQAAQAGGQPAAAAPAPDEKWIKLGEGVFAYLASAGMTVDAVARHISGDPALVDVLADLNGVARGKPLAMQRQIVVPVEFISRPGAIDEMPDALRREIASAQRAQADQAAYKRFVVVHGGHPAGPGAVGLIPLTAGALTAVAHGAKYIAGLVVGLLEGAWDAIKDFFMGVVETIKLVGETLYRLVTLQFGKIWDMLKGWAAQIKQLWANRAQIAADFMEKWNAPDGWDRGKFQGEVLGWVMMTVLITILTLGEGAIEQITGKWANIVKLLKLSQKAGDFATYAKAFGNMASKAAQVAIDAMRASRLGKVVEVAEVAATPIVWTVKTIRAALKLPGWMADEVTEAIAQRLQVLKPYADRIARLSERVKRWLFGCHSPCDWDAEFVRRELDHFPNDEELESAARRAGQEDWSLEGTGGREEEVPVKADPRARGYAIEDRHIRTLEAEEGYERLPDWFKTHDAVRGGTRQTVTENGREIIVINRPDAISIKSTSITDPGRLTAKVTEDLDRLRGGFEHTRGGVRVEGVRRRRLDLIFEEGSQVTPETVRTVRNLQRTAGSIKLEWYVTKSDRIIPGDDFITSMRLTELETAR